MQTTTERTTTKFLHFKWTVSRGRDTYGYNICTLFVDGEKAGRCNGGGYDMTGTSFAQWIESAFQDRLLKLFAQEAEAIKTTEPETFENYTGDTVTATYNSATPSTKDGYSRFYGTTILKNNKTGEVKISLDGACGFSSIEHIAEAINVKLKWSKASDRSKNNSYYTAIITDF